MKRETKRRGNGKFEFYYITHIDNLESILKNGLLSHKRVIEQGINYTSIANNEVMQKRKDKGLEDYVNLYINPRNAMMYVVKNKVPKDSLVVIAINGNVIRQHNDIKVSIGNAASDYSLILDKDELIYLDIYKFFYEIRRIKDWTSETQIDISEFFKDKRPHKFLSLKVFLQSEVLIKGKIEKELFTTIYVPNENIKEKVKRITNLPVINAPEFFFEPVRRQQILDNIWIVQGDMFTSEHELLTISVNTVGVMGKGLASRFKYMYPSVYVVYQKLCKQGKLKLGQPFIYDAPELQRKFLLFPTKGHWREKSRIEKIEEGLKWFLDNYKSYDIKSAAFPALGCGLGGLKWEDVGPLMVKLLSQADIPIEIYLPEEKKTKDEYFSPEFYLKNNI